MRGASGFDEPVLWCDDGVRVLGVCCECFCEGPLSFLDILHEW